MEKGHPTALPKALLTAFDNEGWVKDTKSGRKISTKDVVFIMTSNMGEDEVLRAADRLWSTRSEAGRSQVMEGVMNKVHRQLEAPSLPDGSKNLFSSKAFRERIALDDGMRPFILFFPYSHEEISLVAKLNLIQRSRQYQKRLGVRLCWDEELPSYFASLARSQASGSKSAGFRTMKLSMSKVIDSALEKMVGGKETMAANKGIAMLRQRQGGGIQAYGGSEEGEIYGSEDDQNTMVDEGRIFTTEATLSSPPDDVMERETGASSGGSSTDATDVVTRRERGGAKRAPLKVQNTAAYQDYLPEQVKEYALTAVGLAVCAASFLLFAQALALGALMKAALVVVTVLMSALYVLSPELAKAVIKAVVLVGRVIGGLLLGDHWYWGLLAILYVVESEWRRWRHTAFKETRGKEGEEVKLANEVRDVPRVVKEVKQKDSQGQGGKILAGMCQRILHKSRMEALRTLHTSKNSGVVASP